MIIVNALLGIFGLGIVVFVHELGHFIAAKKCGVIVEAFSIGWGKKLFSYKPKNSDTEYRLSLIPIGGYCKMKGEAEFKTAIENKLTEMPMEPGSFQSASWWKRVIIAVSGPAFNVVFAAIVLTFVWYGGYSQETYPNRVILPGPAAGELFKDSSSPAEQAGIMTGDFIVEIDGAAIENYSQIREHCSVKPGEIVTMKIEREGTIIPITLKPRLDPSSGAGIIGVLPWIDPLVGAVLTDSPAEKAGIRANDRILAANGREIRNSIELDYLIKDTRPQVLTLSVSRDSSIVEIILPVEYSESTHAPFGLAWVTKTWHTPKLSLPAALGRGITETGNTIAMVVKGLGLLFSGIDVSKAISGPIAITVMTGEIAQASFKAGPAQGFALTFNFLALISIALFVMNLLPIPLLDGGQIVICVVEGIRRKPLSPSTLMKYQSVGSAIVLVLIVFATANDLFKLVSH